MNELHRFLSGMMASLYRVPSPIHNQNNKEIQKIMKPLFFALSIIALAFCATSKIGLPISAEAATQKVSPVVGNGKIFGVNKPGDANFKAIVPKNGDRVETTLYTPNNDSNKDLGLVKGQKYTMMMLTQPGNNNAQGFFYWAANTPALQNILLNKSTVVRGVGTKNQPLMRGDTYDIRTQPAQGGGTDVTFDFKRGNKYIATFSFVVK
ncbi:MAG: hypothetical protein SF097_12610 [Acidobacteriota bacterium]|nr:hypothetical protein [Acidobacteriota bacterium]